MSLKIVVLAKQVPDTRNVGKDAMKADGTINRAALPAIFNPEDLNALEQALRLKDAHPGSTVTILTMGPGRAADIIREGLFRGADNGYLLTDRAFAVQTHWLRLTHWLLPSAKSVIATLSLVVVRLSTVTRHK
jgi:Electron transfer flavoprotein, beta subunit